MIFLTFGDQPSGVYTSQVIDVCKFLTEQQGKPVPLVAFVSLRGFGATKKKIRAKYRHAYVLPMAPGLKRWRMNAFLLKRTVKRLKETGIFARGPLAVNLALRMKEKGVIEKVGFDGRGAYHAEWTEYDVVPDPGLVAQIKGLEANAVQQSDYRLAVSEALVNHWREKYQYTENDHVVIPCTLNQDFQKPLPSEAEIQQLRAARGYSEEDILLIYAGSSAGWQSFDLVDQFLVRALAEDARLKVLFLARVELDQLAVGKQFPDRVAKDWVAHEQVPAMLAMGDYGILVREDKVTNQVASPTKFAEYLACGLPALISDHLGDYSRFTEERAVGQVISGNQLPKSWKRVSYERKQEIAQLARAEFTKEYYSAAYKTILSQLNRLT